jgi:aminopeptidase-like protein
MSDHQLSIRDQSGVFVSMRSLMEEMFPICRSITGDGVRQTLDILGRHIPIAIREVPSGTQVLDWTVPKEWNIRDAWIKDLSGRRVVDFRENNLHVVSYSVPVRARLTLGELKRHLFSLPDHPDWVPYRTSYYNEAWGFCVTHRQLEQLTDAEYDVCIDTTLADGSLTYGECVVPGESTDEVLLSCHVCHPSLCNDNLAGISLAVALVQHLQRQSQLKQTYRFLFIPGTIGSITWLANNRAHLDRVKYGLVITCVGHGPKFTYKRSRRGDAQIDKIVEYVLAHSGRPFELQDFFPWGYDERQFCSPGFDLPTGCLMRAPHATFPEYHTSADNLEFVEPETLAESLEIYGRVLAMVEENQTYVNQQPYGEPQLGRRGLYAAIGGDSKSAERQLTMLWVLNLADGHHSLLDIAERARIPFDEALATARLLEHHGLLKRTTETT